MHYVEASGHEGLPGLCEVIEPVGKGAFGSVDKVMFKDRKVRMQTPEGILAYLVFNSDLCLEDDPLRFVRAEDTGEERSVRNPGTPTAKLF